MSRVIIYYYYIAVHFNLCRLILVVTAKCYVQTPSGPSAVWY